MGLYVQLLGRAAAQLGRARVDFLPDKRFQLLAFLAYSGTWVSRERLSFLFWPDTTTEQARHNLRQLLRRVQGLGWVNGLEAERQRIRWTVATDLSTLTLDVGNEEEALNNYRGPLLDGLESNGASEFNAWLAVEREHLQGRWRGLLLDRAVELEQIGQYEQAANWLEKLLEQDTLDEEVLQRYMRVATRAGRQLAALRAYQSFAERLAHELDLEPTTTSQHLAQTIREAALSTEVFDSNTLPLQQPPIEAAMAPSNLPRAATSFVGRAAELGEVTRLLNLKDCRLLTILGLGGIGKTRLALQVAHNLSRDYNHIHFVPMEAFSSADLIPTGIAQALKLSLQGKDSPLAQITHHIAQRQALIVLDNFEGVLDGAPLAAELLKACPGLKLIVTSRERLKLAEEWLLPIEGMLYSNDSLLSLEDALALDAVQLFVSRAQQVQPGFLLGRGNLPHIMRICQLVEGSPLGIELAATWVRAIPVAEIAREIERSLDFLSSVTRNSPARHHSLRATFEYSWNLLSPVEQEALRKLSIFVGGFTREAAAVVADTPSTVLAALLDKSLLRVSQNGRYDCHSLLFHFMRDKSVEYPLEQVRMKKMHRAYFRHFLEHQWQKLLGQQGSEGVVAIAEDFENIRLSWYLALEKRQVKEVLATIPALTFFFDAQVRYVEGIDLFEEASLVFTEDSSQHRRVLGNLRSGQAWLNLWVGHLENALHLVPEVLRLLNSTRGEWGVWLALRTHGFISFFTGDFDEASRCWSKELATLKEGTRLPLEAELLSRLALVHAWIGDLDTASRYLAEALVLKSKLGRYSMLTCLLYAGFAELTLGRPQAAQALLQEAEELALGLGDVRYLPHLAYGHGISALELGLYSEAKVLCQKGLGLAEQNDDLLAKCWSRIFLGRAQLALGECEHARICLQLGLREAYSLGFAPAVRYGMIAFAELQATEGRVDQASDWLNAIITHSENDYFAKAYARRVLSKPKVQKLIGTNDASAKHRVPRSLEELVKELFLSY